MVQIAFLLVAATDRWRQQIPLAMKMIESAKRHMPKAEIHQMTMPGSYVLPGVSRAHYLDANDDELMPYRLLHLAKFPVDRAIFVDTDIVFQADVSDVFDKPFDVALTTRHKRVQLDGRIINGEMPYNIGVMFSRPTDLWRDAYEKCLTYEKEHRMWYGDQMAIAETVRDYDVLELDGKTFNYTPEREDEDISMRKIVHYKGDRKDWMLRR